MGSELQVAQPDSVTMVWRELVDEQVKSTVGSFIRIYFTSRARRFRNFSGLFFNIK
jgi:hypothetical protein